MHGKGGRPFPADAPQYYVHLSETKYEVDKCQSLYGKSPVALLDDLGVFDCGALAAHCVWVSAEDIKILADKKVRVAHNPSSNLKLASGAAPVAAMLEAGVTVALGTDGATSNNKLDMLEEIRMASFYKNCTAWIRRCCHPVRFCRLPIRERRRHWASRFTGPHRNRI